jgi:cobalt transporter subunit CbtA
MLRRIVVAAAIAGFLAGLLLTAGEQWRITALIRTAEVLDNAGMSARGHEHREESTKAWRPHDDRQRFVATTVANVILAVGYSLLLSAGLTLRRQSGWLPGLGWGMAGFVVFFAAPAMGLPPDLPGAPTAALSDRVTWWCFTVACTGAAFWLVFFGTHRRWRLLGLTLLVIPHFFGAPEAGLHEADATSDLMHEFAVQATFVNLAFWLLLGVVTGALLGPERELYSEPASEAQ